ncbi:MAG: hypothetical protein U5R31_00265 [Acidimicrobiia bacterium]|nr:hypothetical protein [Acidimicrobiia bacterium]
MADRCPVALEGGVGEQPAVGHADAHRVVQVLGVGAKPDRRRGQLGLVGLLGHQLTAGDGLDPPGDVLLVRGHVAAVGHPRGVPEGGVLPHVALVRVGVEHGLGQLGRPGRRRVLEVEGSDDPFLDQLVGRRARRLLQGQAEQEEVGVGELPVGAGLERGALIGAELDELRRIPGPGTGRRRSAR